MALSADRNTARRDGVTRSLPVAGGVTIYAGALVVRNASGYVTPGATATGLVALGRASTQADNSAGSDGAISVEVQRGVFLYANYGSDQVTAADVGATCYIYDDETVAKTDGTGTRSAAGTVFAVDSAGVWVEI